MTQRAAIKSAKEQRKMFDDRLAELRGETEQLLESDLKLAYNHGQMMRTAAAQVFTMLLL
jgi:hypothetical protein